MLARESQKNAPTGRPLSVESVRGDGRRHFLENPAGENANPSLGLVAIVAHRAARVYARHPRSLWIGFLSFMLLFVIAQSYLAQPRPLAVLFRDLWDLSVLFFPLILLIWKNDIRWLLAAGLLFLAVSGLMWAGAIGFIKPAYGTLFFICALWFIGDWFNTRRFGKSVFSELLEGNYYLALGIFLATVLVGAVVEIANIPFRLWWYQWPFPSLEIMGLPVIMVAFGWLPWVLAMFVVLYPFALQEPQQFSRK
jgi:hypothetical protein